MEDRGSITGYVCTGLVALTLAVAACGSGAPPGAPVPARSAVEGLTGRTCHYVGDFESTPSLTELTRAGTVGNIALWGRGQGSADSVELSIRYAYDGQLDWVRAVKATMDPEAVTDLEGLVLEAVAGSGTPDWGIRVLVVGGEVVRTEPSVICRPERTGGSIWSGSPYSRDALGDVYAAGSQRIPVRVTLDDQGRVMDVALVRSTYNRWLDQYIVDAVRNSTYHPKLHDGFGVVSTLELDVRIPRR